jgi:hypothetical protein
LKEIAMNIPEGKFLEAARMARNHDQANATVYTFIPSTSEGASINFSLGMRKIGKIDRWVDSITDVVTAELPPSELPWSVTYSNGNR